MKPIADAVRLTVHLDAGGPRSPQAVASDVVALAHAAGLLAATVYPKVRPDTLPRQGGRSISLSEQRALTVTIIDSKDRIRTFLPQLHGVLGEDPTIRLDPVNDRYQLSQQL